MGSELAYTRSSKPNLTAWEQVIIESLRTLCLYHTLYSDFGSHLTKSDGETGERRPEDSKTGAVWTGWRRLHQLRKRI